VAVEAEKKHMHREKQKQQRIQRKKTTKKQNTIDINITQMIVGKQW